MNLILLAADLVAISVLLLAFYLPRHGRRELVSSFLVINVGVLAVATALSNGTIDVRAMVLAPLSRPDSSDGEIRSPSRR